MKKIFSNSLLITLSCLLFSDSVFAQKEIDFGSFNQFGESSGQLQIGSQWGGGSLNNGLSMGSGGFPAMNLEFGQSSCPFKSSSNDVNNLWDSARGTLQTIASQNEQSERSCTSLQTSASSLEQALAQYSGQKFRRIDSTSNRTEVNCENYEQIYQLEYEGVMNLVSRNYIVQSLPTGYSSNCSIPHAKYSETKEYPASFIVCLGDTLAQKIEVGNLKCRDNSTLDNIENQRARFQARQEAISGINGAIENLANGIGKCSNEDLVQASIRSAIDVGTMFASSSMGGFAGVAAAFGGNILNNLVGVLFRDNTQSTIAKMRREEDYATMACLFYSAQKLRCDEDIVESAFINQPSCNPPKVPSEVDILLDQFSSLKKRLPRVRRKTKQYLDTFYQPNNRLGGRRTIDYLETPVLSTLQENGFLEEVSSLRDSIAKIKFINSLNTKIISGEVSAPIENPFASGSELTLVEPITLLNQIQEELVASSSIESALVAYNSFDGEGVDQSVLAGAQATETVSLINESIYGELELGSGWKDTRKLDYSISALVNNLKGRFEDRLEAHFKSDFNSAIQVERENPESLDIREAAFNQLSGVVNDCLYAQGMFNMQSSDLDSGARSTTLIAKNRSYSRYCGNLKCEDGIPADPTDITLPNSYRKAQCSQIYTGSESIGKMKAKYLETGKICGKSLTEILREGR